MFADPDHAAARELYADTLDSSPTAPRTRTWRNFFLSGATELRTGNFGTPTQTASPSMLAQLSPGADVRHPRHQRQRAEGLGPRPRHRRDLPRPRHQLPADAAQRRAGLPQGDADEATANATVKLANKLRLLAFAAGDTDSPGLEVAGDADALPSLLAVLDRPDPNFNIVTP